MEKEQVYEIIADKLGVELSLVKDEADLREDLGGDSLDIIEVVMELESRFGVMIDDAVYDTVHTVGDVIKLIEQYDH